MKKIRLFFRVFRDFVEVPRYRIKSDPAHRRSEVQEIRAPRLRIQSLLLPMRHHRAMVTVRRPSTGWSLQSQRAENVPRVGDEHVRHIGRNPPGAEADEIGQLVANDSHVAAIECGLRVVQLRQQAVLGRRIDRPVRTVRAYSGDQALNRGHDVERHRTLR